MKLLRQFKTPSRNANSRQEDKLFNAHEYRLAPSGIGPHAFTWKDKPHRLVYDLCHEIERLQALALDNPEPWSNAKHCWVVYCDDVKEQSFDDRNDAIKHALCCAELFENVTVRGYPSRKDIKETL